MQNSWAKSLELIAEHGGCVFIKGDCRSDLPTKCQKRRPDHQSRPCRLQGSRAYADNGEYRGYQVFSMPPPPSSEDPHRTDPQYPSKTSTHNKYSFGSADAMRVMAEAEKHAYADRSVISQRSGLRQSAVAGANQQSLRQNRLHEQIDINKSQTFEPDSSGQAGTV